MASMPRRLGIVSRNNTLYLIIGALLVVIAVMGYQFYQEHKKPEGLRIDVRPSGLSIDKK
jgi:RsiW-degrading membrane proteinase PrsW (M82 family)